MCAWKRWESCSCSDRVAALLFDILSLYYIQTVLSCFCASQYYIFVLYCKFPIINKMSSEGIYTFVCTQVYLFFWYADLFFDTSRVRRWKVEDDRRRKTKWLSYSCIFFLGETFFKLKTECACQGRDLGPLHTWIDWIYRTCIKNKQHHVGIIACSVTNLSGEKVLNTLINSQQKETYVKKCTQTAVWSDFHYLYSSGIFTHRFLFPVYIFKDPAGVHIFSLKSYLFVCTVGKVVYRLYTYCTLVIITVIFFSCVKLNTHACQRLFTIL